MVSRSSTWPCSSASRKSSSNSRRVRSRAPSPTKAWKRSGRISSSPTTSGAASESRWPRRRRRDTASIRAIASSGMAGLGDPVVDAEAQPAHPLRHRRAAGADDQAEVGEHRGDTLQVVPAFVAQQRRVDQQGVELHRHQIARGHRAGALAQLPARRVGALGKNGDEATVVIDYRKTDGLLWVGLYAPAAGEWPAFSSDFRGPVDRQILRFKGFTGERRARANSPGRALASA